MRPGGYLGSVQVVGFLQLCERGPHPTKTSYLRPRRTGRARARGRWVSLPTLDCVEEEREAPWAGGFARSLYLKEEEEREREREIERGARAEGNLCPQPWRKKERGGCQKERGVNPLLLALAKERECQSRVGAERGVLLHRGLPLGKRKNGIYSCRCKFSSRDIGL